VGRPTHPRVVGPNQWRVTSLQKRLPPSGHRWRESALSFGESEARRTIRTHGAFAIFSGPYICRYSFPSQDVGLNTRKTCQLPRLVLRAHTHRREKILELSARKRRSQRRHMRSLCTHERGCARPFLLPAFQHSTQAPVLPRFMLFAMATVVLPHPHWQSLSLPKTPSI
jgi:hypothetical protein